MDTSTLGKSRPGSNFYFGLLKKVILFLHEQFTWQRLESGSDDVLIISEAKKISKLQYLFYKLITFQTFYTSCLIMIESKCWMLQNTYTID